MEKIEVHSLRKTSLPEDNKQQEEGEEIGRSSTGEGRGSLTQKTESS